MNEVLQRDDAGNRGDANAEQAAALVPGREDDGIARGPDRHDANLAAALRLARAGVPVFPVRVFQGPNGEWKKLPAIKDWQRAASTDATQVESWWEQFPDAVAGIALGRCGLVVVDPTATRAAPTA